jgi:predicted PurR-regulated permease PerM
VTVVRNNMVRPKVTSSSVNVNPLGVLMACS